MHSYQFLLFLIRSSTVIFDKNNSNNHLPTQWGNKGNNKDKIVNQPHQLHSL
uniref:Uncharacterized protein n=1 Tax=Anguilla anguilla TaxID=7936 RepID=A0A0E9U545_ANGAN